MTDEIKGTQMSDTAHPDRTGPDRTGPDRGEGELRGTYLMDHEVRPTSAARGVHHVALVSSDVERTIRFYQEVLEFPLTELFENRDYAGSTDAWCIATPPALSRPSIPEPSTG